MGLPIPLNVPSLQETKRELDNIELPAYMEAEKIKEVNIVYLKRLDEVVGELYNEYKNSLNALETERNMDGDEVTYLPHEQVEILRSKRIEVSAKMLHLIPKIVGRRGVKQEYFKPSQAFGLKIGDIIYAEDTNEPLRLKEIRKDRDSIYLKASVNTIEDADLTEPALKHSKFCPETKKVEVEDVCYNFSPHPANEYFDPAWVNGDCSIGAFIQPWMMQEILISVMVVRNRHIEESLWDKNGLSTWYVASTLLTSPSSLGEGAYEAGQERCWTVLNHKKIPYHHMYNYASNIGDTQALQRGIFNARRIADMYMGLAKSFEELGKDKMPI